MTSVNWPPQEKRKLIGTRIDRVDGPAKSSGAAKYSLDINRPDMLYGKILGASIAAGTLKSLDTSAAEALKGVEAVHVMTDAGKPINWAGQEIVALAATTEEIANEATQIDQGGIRTRPAQRRRCRSPESRGQSAHADRWRSGERFFGGGGNGFGALRRDDDYPLLPGTARSGIRVPRRRIARVALDSSRVGFRRAIDAAFRAGSQQDPHRLPIHGRRLWIKIWRRCLGCRLCGAGEESRQAGQDALGSRPGIDDRWQPAVGFCRH